MRSKISFTLSVFIISIVGIIFSAVIIYFPTPEILVQPVVSIIVPQQIVSGLPVRLKIPKIHTDAFIEYVGLTTLGAMDVPKGPDDVAWFDLGPRPGENGSAVIAGHYGWKNNIPAVFDSLSTLRTGDIIYVEDGMGSTTTFVVRKLQLYGEKDNASNVFSSNDGLAHLNLITCEGVWNPTKKSYSDRLVVFADKKIK